MTFQQRDVAESGGPDGGAPAAMRLVRFLAGLAVILLFAFGVIPALQRLPPVRQVREAANGRGIDATALLYTESEVYGEAEGSIRNALRYPARRPECPAAPRSDGHQQVE